MSDRWQPTDLLKIKGSTLRVKRINAMGVGNHDLGTEDGVIYWLVEPSSRYKVRTGIHMIPMVPETRLTPIKESHSDS